MNIFRMLLLGAAALPACLYAQVRTDSVTSEWEHEFDLNEIVVVARRPVLKQQPDRIVYLTKNDPYALGMNGIQVLDRIPRVTVTNDLVSVAGKSSVRYIIDGQLLDINDEAISIRLKNLQSSDIEKIELLTTPPAKYSAAAIVAFISITTRNESLGTRGSIWGNTSLSEKLSYMAGGNLSHTTRKIELSADLGLQAITGINDLHRIYTFPDKIKESDRSTHFTNSSLGANALFKYKFSKSLSAGAILNYNSIRFKSDLHDITTDNGARFISNTLSPARPDNAITITTFGDWKLDDTGKMLSLTYNIFRRHIHSFSDVTTEDITGAQTSLTDAGKNRYCIHSVKFDASLPFRTFKIETGVAYTGINNKTELEIKNYIGNEWMNNLLQSNSFNYTEHTAAIYASAEKNFSDGLFGKLGLRYEYTDVSGRQPVAAARNDKTYGYIFPSLTLSWNNNRIGRISFSYSSGIIRPSFGDLNPFRYFTTVSDYYSGNPDLKPGITHNAEINYSFKGIYTVIYNSFTHNAIWNVTRFNTDGSQYTQPENCLETNKAGLYASYNRSIFSWWNMNIGGEVYYNYAGSKISDFRDGQDHSWSGKLEFNTSWMLNRSKTLIFNLRFSHLFPHHDKMVRYSSVSLLGCDLRYALLDNRLNLALAVSDPFGWNITKSKSYFSGYTLESRNNIHAHAVSFRVSWSLGRQKVNNPYRDSKERESRRSN